jgi:hypothetical protein
MDNWKDPVAKHKCPKGFFINRIVKRFLPMFQFFFTRDNPATGQHQFELG